MKNNQGTPLLPAERVSTIPQEKEKSISTIE
jgi:hypothetical protein